MKKLIIVLILLFIPVWSYSGSQQVSGTTGTAFIAFVRTDYNDDDSPYFASADILKFINDGMLDIANRTHCYQTTESVTLVSGTIEYAISTSYIEILAAQYNDGTNVYSLKRGTPEMVGTSIVEGDTDAPAFWYEFNGKVGIFPALTTAAGETVVLYVAKRPSTIASGATIVTPEIYDIALKHYVLARMAFKDRNFAIYNSMMALYEKETGFYRQDLQSDTK